MHPCIKQTSVLHGCGKIRNLPKIYTEQYLGHFNPQVLNYTIFEVSGECVALTKFFTKTFKCFEMLDSRFSYFSGNALADCLHQSDRRYESVRRAECLDASDQGYAAICGYGGYPSICNQDNQCAIFLNPPRNPLRLRTVPPKIEEHPNIVGGCLGNHLY